MTPPPKGGGVGHTVGGAECITALGGRAGKETSRSVRPELLLKPAVSGPAQPALDRIVGLGGGPIGPSRAPTIPLVPGVGLLGHGFAFPRQRPSCLATGSFGRAARTGPDTDQGRESGQSTVHSVLTTSRSPGVRKMRLIGPGSTPSKVNRPRSSVSETMVPPATWSSTWSSRAGST